MADPEEKVEVSRVLMVVNKVQKDKIPVAEKKVPKDRADKDKAMENNVPLKGKDKAKVRADKMVEVMVARVQEVNKVKVLTDNKIK